MKADERTRLIIGEPEQCVAQLKKLGEEGGINHVILHGSLIGLPTTEPWNTCTCSPKR